MCHTLRLAREAWAWDVYEQEIHLPASNVPYPQMGERAWDLYEQELHLPRGNVQYPLRDEGGLGRLKYILRASTSKFNDLGPVVRKPISLIQD